MSHSSSDPIEFQISRGYTTVIDAVDVDLTSMKWYSVNKSGRIYVWRKWGYGDSRKLPTKYIHRVIYERVLGRPLTSRELVDHIDNNPLNNRRSNLRLATKSTNAVNTGIQANNTSGYRGVWWHKQINKWVAEVRVKGVKHYLGTFNDPAEASRVYEAARRKYFGEFAA